MELTNATGMAADYALGMQPDGRELVVIVVKGTFAIPGDRGEPKLLEEQPLLIPADFFAGEPGRSAPLAESDYAPIKRKCDILLNGTAHSPGGKPATRVTVALRIGSLSKSFDVVGKRVWKTKEEPEPFTTRPISYDRAFGGPLYAANPVGIGSFPSPEAAEGNPLPDTEETGKPVTDPKGDYRPMSFGPIGRSWQPRAKLAGTYDQNWTDNVCPFLPSDFDERYYQAAPEDQQTDLLQGGEEVELTNLTPEGRLAFSLPKRTIPVLFARKDGEKVSRALSLDTVLVEPDHRRFALTWRAAVPLRKNLFDIPWAAVGAMSPGWRRALEVGKAHAPSLNQIKARKPLPERTP